MDEDRKPLISSAVLGAWACFLAASLVAIVLANQGSEDGSLLLLFILFAIGMVGWGLGADSPESFFWSTLAIWAVLSLFLLVIGVKWRNRFAIGVAGILVLSAPVFVFSIWGLAKNFG